MLLDFVEMLKVIFLGIVEGITECFQSAAQDICF